MILFYGAGLSWKTVSPRTGMGQQIHAPKPEELGTVLPPEPATAQGSAPAASKSQQRPVKVRRFKESPQELVDKGLIPPPEEVERMEKKGVISY